jgi:hypothetical protein
MAETAFQYFQGRTNSRVVNLLERNHDVSKVVLGLLEALVQFADDKGVPIERVKLHDAYLEPTDAGYAQLRARFVVR